MYLENNLSIAKSLPMDLIDIFEMEKQSYIVATPHPSSVAHGALPEGLRFQVC